MIRGLTVLNSSINGARDLWWPRYPLATKGFNIYRAFDAPTNWVKLNQNGPIPGYYYRDITRLQTTQFVVPPEAWIDKGQTGEYCFKLPDIPYSTIHEGRPRVATSPEDVAVYITDTTTGSTSRFRPKMVSGIDQTVFLPVDKSLPIGGAVSDFPIIDFATMGQVTCVYNTLVNFVDIALNLLRTYYTVVPVTEYGEEHPPGAFGSEIVNSQEVDKIDYTFAEMVRRNSWIFEQTGEPARLMLRRWHGERCGCVATGETRGRTACPVCYETGVVGGYYGPFDFLFIDPDVAATRKIDEGGIMVERPSASYLGRTPIVQDGDLIIRANGERLIISGVTYKSPRGVILQQQFSVTPLNPLDTRYLIPINEPECPLIYNPVSQTHIPGDGAQPVFDAHTVPGKHWENKDPQIGRSITFGRIQT